eukprot:gnl/TRDRNA2_/TRDRNA2_187050_c0_seq1.p1 gnl/TRDRNA2_/TRDRNA2_187050_c0~~gnl/TRDRNA2_/TRDRNA2_187050_c0_seq1.p1  ORF type:complete len:363 (+),score=107.63 gnl/TRDRNA2_/TRDRNA2_187050_c0_seq1:55-1143(+)
MGDEEAQAPVTEQAGALDDYLQDASVAQAAYSAAQAAARRRRNLSRVRERERERASGEGDAGCEKRQLRQRCRQVEDELESLKEVYARQISNNEQRFERQLRAKEEECNSWFKNKKQEIRSMQSGCMIMHLLFEKRRRKFCAKMEADKEAFDRDRIQFHNDMERLEAEKRAELEQATQDLEQNRRAFEQHVESLHKVNAEAGQRQKELEDRLAEKSAEVDRLIVESRTHEKEIERLKKKLLDAEQAEELAKKNAQIEALEAELRRTKRTMREHAQLEADGLRKELMEYVKFIVHILPEDWQAHYQPPELAATRLKELASEKQRSMRSPKSATSSRTSNFLPSPHPVRPSPLQLINGNRQTPR